MWPGASRLVLTKFQPLLYTIRYTAFSSSSKSTVSEDEMRKFSGLNSSVWWQSAEYAPLRSMNRLRVPLIVNSLVDESTKIKTIKTLSPYKLLDVGCGGGLLSEQLARLGGQVTGIDPVSTSIDAANDHKQLDSSLTSLQYICTNIETLASDPSNHSRFNAVIASEVLEHVSNVKLFLRSAHDLLVPNGRLIITTINQTLASRIFAITVAEKILHLLPEGTHSYDNFVPVNGLILMLSELGFTVESAQGMCYNPISGDWSWIPSTAINYAVLAIKSHHTMASSRAK